MNIYIQLESINNIFIILLHTDYHIYQTILPILNIYKIMRLRLLTASLFIDGENRYHIVNSVSSSWNHGIMESWNHGIMESWNHFREDKNRVLSLCSGDWAKQTT